MEVITFLTCALLIAFSPGYSSSLAQGVNWIPIRESGARNLEVNSTDYVFASSNGLYISTDRGGSWIRLDSGWVSTDVYSVAFSNGNEVFAATMGGGVYKSNDGGLHWVQSNIGLTNLDAGLLLMTSTGALFASTYVQGIYRSLDLAGNWNRVDTMDHAEFWAFHHLGADSLLAGSYIAGVYLSTDNGDSWEVMSGGWDVWTWTSFAEDSRGRLFGGTPQGVYISTDRGRNWSGTACCGGGSYVTSLVVNASDQLFAGSRNDGVYFSADGGESWLRMNSGLTDSSIRSLAADGDGYLYAATWTTIYRSVESTTFREGEDEGIREFSLEQNYPNPFNPSTKIVYRVGSRGSVELTVFDLLGRKIATLVNEMKEPGMYSVSWDASGFASSVYFYRLTAGSFNKTKKLLLLR